MRHLDRDLTPKLIVSRQVDLSETSFPDLLQNLVPANLLRCELRWRGIISGRARHWGGALVCGCGRTLGVPRHEILEPQSESHASSMAWIGFLFRRRAAFDFEPQ